MPNRTWNKERHRQVNRARNAACWRIARKYPSEFKEVYAEVRAGVEKRTEGWTNKRISNLARHRAVRVLAAKHDEEYQKKIDEILIERGHNPRDPIWVEYGRRPDA